MSALTETVQHQPPESLEILALLAERLATDDLATLDPETLIGVDRETLACLAANDRPLTQSLLDLGVRTVADGRLLLALDPLAGNDAKSREVLNLLAQAVRQARLSSETLLVFAAADATNAARLIQTLVGPQLVLALPRQGRSETISGVRVIAEPADLAAADWTPLQAGGRLLGWLLPDGVTVRSRFHPFLTAEGRLTVASASERQRLVYELLSLARRTRARRPDTTGDLDGWRHSLATAQQLLAALREADRPLKAEAERQRLALAQARERAERLSAEFAEALRELDELQVTTTAASQRRRRAGSDYAQALAKQLEGLRALPQLRTVEIDSGWLLLQTQPLALRAGDELLSVPSITFRLTLAFGSDPAQLLRFDVPADHPLTGSNARCLGESFIPFCQQLAADNLVAAAQIVCGFLQAPLRETAPERFTRAEPGTAPGFARD